MPDTPTTASPSRGELMNIRSAAMALRNAETYADFLKANTCSARGDRRIPSALIDVECCAKDLDRALAKSGDFPAKHRLEETGDAA